jgi:hypothetical protein
MKNNSPQGKLLCCRLRNTEGAAKQISPSSQNISELAWTGYLSQGLVRFS